ncbi:hypothetical protein ACQP2K_08675 [Microbispora siamensis]
MTARVTARATIALAVADFRERVRRPAYALILLAAVGLALLAVPPADSGWVILDVGGYRGVYTSAWVGTATALAGALWLTMGGFYLVRDAIGRDERTRVGQLVAATPLRTPAYLLGKFLSDFLVLASMAGVLAVTAPIMQLARGESGAVDPVALLLPFATITLPPLALTAAAAVLFETVPLLRGGVGNVVWFVVSLVLLIGGQSRKAPLGGLGVHAATQGAADSMRAALTAQGVDVHGREFSLGLTSVARPLRTFQWDGFSVTGAFLGGRLVVLLLALVLALLPCLWFARFDPARRLTTPAVASYEQGGTADSGRPAFRATSPAMPLAVPGVGPRPGRASRRLLSGELRILLQGVSRWWWLVAAGVTAAAFATPEPATVLPFAWIWPVLIWSRLGTQRWNTAWRGCSAPIPRPGAGCSRSGRPGSSSRPRPAWGPSSAWRSPPTGPAWGHGRAARSWCPRSPWRSAWPAVRTGSSRSSTSACGISPSTGRRPSTTWARSVRTGCPPGRPRSSWPSSPRPCSSPPWPSVPPATRPADAA